ncbi:MAG: type II secretion system protein [Erysipelotrichia bacterium]|nr:type II secretion system protein [Erysipelotrichia bacterium]
MSLRPIITNRNNKHRSGVTLVEILVVSVVMALMAALAFPVYKVIQQRDKERRLKKILTDVRAAIFGSKSQQSSLSFTEGYRTHLRVRGIALIEAAHSGYGMEETEAVAISNFVDNLTTHGLGYPLTPSHLVANTTYYVTVATATVPTTAGDYVTIPVDRRYLRVIPPHPFQNWYPNAHWEFKPATTTTGLTSLASASWNSNTATGVADIVSRGAGISLDGSNTDAW